MKKMMFLLCLLSMLWLAPSCGNPSTVNTVEGGDSLKVVCSTDTIKENVQPEIVMASPEVVNQKNCFILISKPELKLYVCEAMGTDTVRRVVYPICVGLNKGQKQKVGDMRTPECTAANPFVITEIVNASKWCHDFNDGRGNILAYGDWFMRLKTPGFVGIGIHGSTNNESSVPGRGSEGCIRLRNEDLNQLKEKYAFVGMRVVILADL